MSPSGPAKTAGTTAQARVWFMCALAPHPAMSETHNSRGSTSLFKVAALLAMSGLNAQPVHSKIRQDNSPMKCLLFANTDWYLYNFCLPLVETLQREGHELLLVSPPGAYGEKMREKGFRWVAAPMERESLNLLRELSLLAWLWKLMRREQPDIVHSFTIKAVVYGGLIGRFIGAGRVNSVSGMGYVFISDAPKARVLRPVVRFLLGLALGGERSRLIVQNTDDVHFAKSRGVARPNRIRLLRGAGVNCTRFSPSSEQDTSAARKPLRVLLAARM